MHQKWYKNGHLEKNQRKCSKLIITFSIHKHTCELQHLSTIREPTGDILYIVFTFRRVRWNLRIYQKRQRMFLFLGDPFQWRFPNCHLHRNLLCSAHRSRWICFFFFIFVLYFSSVSVFVTTVRFVRSEQKKYILIAKFIMINLCVIEKYVNVFLRGERQALRLLCFRKIIT